MLRQEFFLAFAMFFGHGAFWTFVFNALHSQPIPCRVKRFTERLLAAIAAVPLLALPYWADGMLAFAGHPGFEGYKYFCFLVGVFTLLSWFSRQLHSDAACGLKRVETKPVTVRQKGEPPLLAKGWQRVANSLNESERFVVERKTLAIPALPEAWRGLRVAHLTDIHFTGRIKKPFYDAVIKETLELQADVIVITGDIIESTECDEWLESTLGRLTAPLGVYFILGNHDLEMPSLEQVRQRLTGLGMTNVGGEILYQETERGRLTLAGNELPWIGTAPALPSERDENSELRIGLLHTPDTFRWAVESRCHLAVAGHTHGGQVRLPLIGPVICPSFYGCRYAQGVFRRGETVLHIGRGIAAMHPVRFRCPPELTLLTLADEND